ncbi:hypothetical protein SLEP1_g7873 [Rubroshorea leprosula]|uniref:Uncharacterized protein n=1 Tax=Rubroshorea leprosula TaxID=152421 RepID=A0AAV5I9R8_9ROSI|nr:hypothetical protein SLEP1_g7873 [Rubroshorea leprosula]
MDSVSANHIQEVWVLTMSTASQGFGSPSTPQSRCNCQQIGFCYCYLPPVRKTSLTSFNYGKRSWGCSKYPKDDAKIVQWYEQHPDEKKPWCDFFVWFDGEFDPQAKAWLTRYWEKQQKMLEKEKTLMTEVLEVKKENLDFHRELHVLKDSYSELEKKVATFER